MDLELQRVGQSRGQFLGESTYSELLSLSTELATDMASLSVLTGCLGVAVGPPLGYAWFDFFCCSPIAAGVAVLGAAVSVSLWDLRSALAPAHKVGHLVSLVITWGGNVGSYR